jgi:hypothetical protein
MGSAQGKVEGKEFVISSKSPVYVQDIRMGNQSKTGFRFVTVPTSNHVMNGAYVSFLYC